VAAAGLAPGILLGAHVAGLIFFLNPKLPFQLAPVLRGVAVYGGLLGGASLLLHLPFLWGRPRRARRWLPWSLTLALAAAAVLDATHASLYAYFLPSGINDRLIRTALWVALGALIVFYTALLHTLHRRRYGWRSRYGLALVAILSVYACLERREAFRPRPAGPRRPAAVEPGERPRLLVVGIETATLDAILPLAGQGRLAFLGAAIQGGAYGRIASISPPRRDALWMTLATGKWPSKHGVSGGRIYPSGWLARGSELRLIPTGMSFALWGTLGSPPLEPRVYPREALALWEILPRLGVPAGVVGWPAAAPASDTLFSLSDRFFAGHPEPGSIRPPELAGRARGFRPRPRGLDPVLRAHLGSPVPARLVAAQIQDSWRHALALSLLGSRRDTKVLFLMLPGLREASRLGFGGFERAQFEGERDPATQQAAERVAAYYEMVDRLLGEIWESQGGPRVLAVVSPYGAQGRSPSWPRGAVSRRAEVGGTIEGAPDGTLILYGAGIRRGALLTGARLVDLAPTLLYAAGFPVARDFDGRILTDAIDRAFVATHPVTFFPSYEALGPREAPR
jgi:Type I phosphodiesterase / nucleotide pyrophosphatase